MNIFTIDQIHELEKEYNYRREQYRKLILSVKVYVGKFKRLKEIKPPPSTYLKISEIDMNLDIIQEIDFQDRIDKEDDYFGRNWKPFFGEDFYAAFRNITQPIEVETMKGLLKRDGYKISPNYKFYDSLDKYVIPYREQIKKTEVKPTITDKDKSLTTNSIVEQMKNEARVRTNIILKQKEKIKTQNQQLISYSKYRKQEITDKEIEKAVDSTRKKNGSPNYTAAGRILDRHRDTVKKMIVDRNLTWLIDK